MKHKGPIKYDISVSAAKSKHAPGRSRARVATGGKTDTTCQHPGCSNQGEYRAPAVPGRPDSVKFLCRKHAGQYNSDWNWFSKVSEDVPDPDITPEREEPRGVEHKLRLANRSRTGQPPQRRLTNVELRALRVLNLGQNSSIEDIRREYRSLVKDLHPDNNGGDRSDEGRLKEVVHAWNVLRKSWNHSERASK